MGSECLSPGGWARRDREDWEMMLPATSQRPRAQGGVTERPSEMGVKAGQRWSDPAGTAPRLWESRVQRCGRCSPASDSESTWATPVCPSLGVGCRFLGREDRPLTPHQARLLRGGG